MICPVATDPRASGTSVFFEQNSAVLSPTALATLSSVAAAWHAGGGAGVLRVDGYASLEGDDPLNWRLSCNRALMVEAELMAPSDHSPGVPFTNIEHFAHGETGEFSCKSLPPNRRAVITTSGGAPAPGPPCGLTITGPHELDHYCAAYVPSDAASCGTFPAPNITLAATGGAPGSTLQWSIVRGTSHAAIVGPTNGASVDIRGLSASGARNDITVQLTDGNCTVTYLLTVRQPFAMTATEAATSTPTVIQDIITYTVQDQFGVAMGANICLDETVTVCSNSVTGATFTFGDAPTNASGQQTDNLRATFPGGIPPDLCVKLNQTITAGGCGPLQRNTITYRPAGITLTHGSSCVAGDPCP